MAKLSCFIALVLLGLITLLTLFPQSAAADQPSTDSTAQAAARKAAIEGLKAVAGEDASAVEKWVTFRYPDGARIIDYNIKQRRAERELRDTVAKKFGKPGATYAANQAPDHESLDSEIGHIDNGSIAINGDTATVTSPYSVEIIGPVPGMQRPTWSLKKVGRAWKLLDHHGYAKDVDVPKQWKDSEARLARVQKMTRDVRDGTYKTLDDVDRDVYELKYAAERAMGIRVPPRSPIDPKTGEHAKETGMVIGLDAPVLEPRQDSGNHAKKVVFVLDASEASKPVFDALITQLRGSVDNMRASESFAIIVTSAGSVKKQDDALFPATPESKRKVVEFFKDIHPAGKSDLAAAMTAAIAYQPELIYLTAFDVPANSSLRDSVGALNKNAKVKINTVAVEGKGKLEVELKGIAEDSGGVFKYVSAKDLLSP